MGAFVLYFAKLRIFFKNNVEILSKTTKISRKQSKYIVLYMATTEKKGE